MELTTTDYVAAWGALTGSFVLIWDVIKWFRNGPKVKVRIRPNTFYEDGEVIKVEKTEHGESKTYALYYHIEVVNVGNLPTTLLDIEATTKPLGFERMKRQGVGVMSYSGVAFTPHFGKRLPQVIGPGETWSCRLNENRISDLSQGGNPKIALSVAHLDSPILVKVEKPANNPIKPTR